MIPRKIHLYIVTVVALAVATAIAQTFLAPGAANPAPPAVQNVRQGPHWYEPSALTGAAIQEAIYAAYRGGGRVYLPGGDYRVSQTIDLQRIGPMVIEGEAFATDDGWRGKGGVRLLWAGEPGGVMIRMSALGVQMKNLSINGNNRAGIGLQLVSEPGWGSALDSFERVDFTGFKGPGFQAGKDLKEGNSADVYFDKCTFNRSDIGFRVIHDQGVCFHFDGCQWGYLKTAIQVDRGGGVYVRGGGGGRCDVFLRSGAGGHNAGPISIRDFRFEYAGCTKKWAQMLDAPDAGGGVRILIDNMHLSDGAYSEPDNVETPILSIGAHVSVHVRDSLLKRAGHWPLAKVNGVEKFPAILILENSSAELDMKDPTLIEHNANGKVMFNSPSPME